MPPREPRGFWYALAVTVLRPLLMALTRRDWRGAQHLPASGPVIVVANHISYVDPLVFAHFLYDNGRLPRFLGKAELFTMPVIGLVVRGAGQIPVLRDTADASTAFDHAVQAVRQGQCVAIYPEATITRDPGLWPMSGKTGAARVALATGAPVIPVAHWGAQDILEPYGKRVRLFPRRTMHVTAGPPVDLSQFSGRELSREVLGQATAKIIDDITGLLEQIRGETAPPVRFDSRSSGLPHTGDPRRRVRDVARRRRAPQRPKGTHERRLA